MMLLLLKVCKKYPPPLKQNKVKLLEKAEFFFKKYLEGNAPKNCSARSRQTNSEAVEVNVDTVKVLKVDFVDK